jgi:micrococcal nuclease
MATISAIASLIGLVGAAPGPALGHPLPLDGSGCHWAGSPPTYHCHVIRDTPRGPGRRHEGERRPPEPGEQTDSGQIVRVIRVSDGDTIHVKIGARTEKVRYIGVNAPERDHAVWPGADMAHAARAVNAKLVLGKRVVLEYDQERRDGLGRVLAYVWVDEVLVNAEMIRLGYAHVVETPNVRHQALLQRVEQEAKAQRRGLWGRIEADSAVVQQGAPPAGGAVTPDDARAGSRVSGD